MKNVRFFLSENFPYFFGCKIFNILNRHVFVMRSLAEASHWPTAYESEHPKGSDSPETLIFAYAITVLPPDAAKFISFAWYCQNTCKIK